MVSEEISVAAEPLENHPLRNVSDSDTTSTKSKKSVTLRPPERHDSDKSDNLSVHLEVGPKVSDASTITDVFSEADEMDSQTGKLKVSSGQGYG